MPNPDLHFDIVKIARELLFIEEFEIYPSEIWDDFREALYLFLHDDEIRVLNHRFASEECEFSFEQRRRILSNLMVRFQESELFDEMDATLRFYENEIFEDILTGTPQVEGSVSFVKETLNRLGIKDQPGRKGNLSYDAMIDSFPICVWRSRESAIPIEALLSMLDAAARAGFGRLFLVAHSSLISNLPPKLDGYIPFTVVPWFDSDPKRDRSLQNRGRVLN